MAKIKFVADYQLTIISDYNAFVRGLSWTTRTREMKRGDVLTGNILAERSENIDIQFSDGSASLGIPLTSLERLE